MSRKINNKKKIKNKIKAAKSNSGSSGIKLPQGWFFMIPAETSVVDIKNILSEDDSYDVEMWEAAGILEIALSEEASLDIESIDTDLGDEYSNSFVEENNIKTIYYVSFKPDAYDSAKTAMEFLAQKTGGFFCGDTEDFTPVIK